MMNDDDFIMLKYMKILQFLAIMFAVELLRTSQLQGIYFGSSKLYFNLSQTGMSEMAILDLQSQQFSTNAFIQRWHLNNEANFLEKEETNDRKRYLCQQGVFGRLNNNLVETMNLLHVAEVTESTLCVMPSVAQMYDITYFQKMFPGSEGRIASNACLNTCQRLSSKSCEIQNFAGYLDNSSGVTLLQNRVRDCKNIITSTKRSYYLNPAHSLDWSSRRSFWGNVVPKRSLAVAARNYVERTFKRRPFVAVHVRNLENGCHWRMKDSVVNEILTPYLAKSKKFDITSVCDLTLQRVLTILTDLFHRPKNGSHLWKYLLAEPNTLHIYKLSDRQKPLIDMSYKDLVWNIEKNAEITDEAQHDTGLRVKVFTSRPDLDFEVATYSNLFLGTHASTASLAISRRRNLQNKVSGINFPSILFYTDVLDIDFFATQEGWET